MPPAPAPLTRALVIVNARSGGGWDDARADDLRRQLAQAQLEADVVLAREAGDLAAALERARSGRFGLVAAGGGDGTQAAVAATLVGTDVVQGVLPLGTLNHFAKDLGIPLPLEDAVRTLAQGRVVQVDVGEVNGRIFLNNSSLGLYPQIVRERELQQLHLGKSKWAALASATLHATGRPHGIAVRIDSEDDEALRRTPFVFIGNNRYTMEGFAIGGRESLASGELAVYLARRRGRLALVRLALRALAKRLAQAEDFEVLTGPAFVIRTRDARIRVATDGEVAIMDTPLRYRTLPKALKVMVPQDPDGAVSP